MQGLSKVTDMSPLARAVRNSLAAFSACGCLLFCFVGVLGLNAAMPRVEPVVWKMDNLTRVGGHTPEVFGAPQIIHEASGDTSLFFDGKNDGMLISDNPLAGLTQFTIEILFKPDEDGEPAQRFFHLQDAAGSRVMIETRLDGKGGWWLDTFLFAKGKGLTLIDAKRVHPTGHWYWVALRYDGKHMTHFVEGRKEGEGIVLFGPMGTGKLSLGVRQNKVYWFKGCIREVRFSPVALEEAALQRTGK